MKLHRLNYLTEDQQLNRLVVILEQVFDDLEDIAKHDTNVIGGIKLLEQIAKGSEIADELSYDDIKLAAAVFNKLAPILINSKNELEEQIKINKLTGRKSSPEPETDI